MAYLLDAATQIICPHGGQGVATPSNQRLLLGGSPALVATDQVTIAGCSFNVSGSPSPCLQVQWLAPANRVKVGGTPALLSTLDRALRQRGERSPGARDADGLPDTGAGPVTEARHPYRLAPARRLAQAADERHIADMVRLVLLTGAGERLHRPDFGAGLGTALFEPLDLALTSMIEMRARGSLERALGDRIEVLELSIEIVGESEIEASLTYRLRPAGTPLQTLVRVGV